MNLYESQRWNHVFRKGKHFLPRMWYPSWCILCRIKEWNVLVTISWPTDVISHGSHWDTMRECQMVITIKNIFKSWSQSSFYETMILTFLSSIIRFSIVTSRLLHVVFTCRSWFDIREPVILIGIFYIDLSC